MIVLTLARKPLIGSVAANALKHGVGGINIDGCRVVAGQDYLEAGWFQGPRFTAPDMGYMGSHQTRPWVQRAIEAGLPVKESRPSTGRWPANLILYHLPGCRCVGERQVSTSDPRRADGSVHSGLGGHGIYGGAHGVKIPRNYADVSGHENIPAWNCQSGCPVCNLDHQSGVSVSTGGRVGNAKGAFSGLGPTGFTLEYQRGDPGFGDTGGASRFFKQVQGDGK